MDSIPSRRRAFNSQVTSSWSSLSCPSEPPDVGNWFSSYEYRSPDPDSNFSLEESAFRGSEPQRAHEELKADFENIWARDEGVVGEKLEQCRGVCVKDDNYNEGVCLTKNLDSFSSCSLFSEPPDIGNWFSSYVYQSSASETISSFRNEEVSEENKQGDERFDFEVVNEDEGRSENVNPKVCVDHNSSFDRNMKVKQKQPSSKGDGTAEKEKLTITNSSHLEKALQPCIKDKTLQHNLGPIKYEQTPSLNHETPGCKREAHLISLFTDTSAMTPPKQVQKHDANEAKSKAEAQADKLDISTSLAKSFSARSSTCTRDKENAGFITTRKNSCTIANDENSCKIPEKIMPCSTNTGTVPLTCEKNGVTKRKALTEATNLQPSNAIEITGKWQCPQKRKPNTGPPLKQLRLERWVYRI